MSPRRIRALTKEGVKSLQEGHFVDAILSLRHAMECLKAEFRTTSSSEETSCDHDCDPSPILEGCLLSQIPISLDQAFLHSVSPHNAFDVYAVSFLYPQVEPTAAGAAFFPEVSIVILYNLALAHHLAGLSGATATNSQRHLQEALRYYKMSLTVFQSPRQKQHFDDSYSLALGLLNNMGQIFCHRFQLSEADTCSKHIDLLLNAPKAHQLSEQDGEFFYGTVLHPRSFGGATAPAA